MAAYVAQVEANEQKNKNAGKEKTKKKSSDKQTKGKEKGKKKKEKKKKEKKGKDTSSIDRVIVTKTKASFYFAFFIQTDSITSCVDNQKDSQLSR